MLQAQLLRLLFPQAKPFSQLLGGQRFALNGQLLVLKGQLLVRRIGVFLLQGK